MVSGEYTVESYMFSIGDWFVYYDGDYMSHCLGARSCKARVFSVGEGC